MQKVSLSMARIYNLVYAGKIGLHLSSSIDKENRSVTLTTNYINVTIRISSEKYYVFGTVDSDFMEFELEIDRETDLVEAYIAEMLIAETLSFRDNNIFLSNLIDIL